MKSSSSAIRSLLSMSALLALVACAMPQASSPGVSDEEHKAHHPDAVSNQTGNPGPAQAAMPAQPGGQMGMMGGQSGGAMGMMGGQGNSQMPMMNMQQMCDMHRKMMSASPGERQAMMGGQMSPQMVEQHMQMMRQQCR